MIPPGGLYALVTTVLMVVLGLAVVNAGRGEWGLTINGGILAAALIGVLVALRPPPKT